MALRNIRDDRDPVLRKKSKEIREITARIRTLAGDMLDTMYNANGVGLAAPQVGILKRIVIVDVSTEEEGRNPHILVNPVITKTEGLCNGTEGCLSIPGVFGYVDRPEKITVEYLDLDGEKQSLEAEGYFARAICHEVDHLDGILFIDKPEYREFSEDDEDQDVEEPELEK